MATLMEERRRRLEARRRRLCARTARRAAPGKAARFESNDELLDAARRMFTAREQLFEAERQMFAARHALAAPGQRLEKQRGKDDPNVRLLAELGDEEKAWSSFWHESLKKTRKNVLLRAKCLKHKLSPVESEILAGLILGQLKLLPGAPDTPQEILDLLGPESPKPLEVLRLLSEQGRLFKSGLLSYDDPDEVLAERRLLVDPSLVDAVVYERGGSTEGWPVRSQKQLYRRMAALTRAFSKKAEALMLADRWYNHRPGDAQNYKMSRRTDALWSGLLRTLDSHPKWKLAALLAELRDDTDQPEQQVLVILLGKELGHLDADNELFKGIGLARGVTTDVGQVRQLLEKLGPKATLIKEGLVQPCGGHDTLISNDPGALTRVEFELTDKCLKKLGIKKRLVKKRSGEAQVREAKVRMKQLVLSGKVRKALDMVFAQTRHKDVLLSGWGLGKTITYGRGVTVLFSGPPGVGKTACAEALAHKLNKPILVADYSEIQDCFVGQTAKNIARMFHQAKAHNALLFWDEADAMFYDRDSARWNWEVRDVNVLLQEIENFDDICVLATNRKITLDKALERRIGIKVEFDRPDRSMRFEIWRKLLPKKLPLAKDLDFDVLASENFTGGEIKNVVLNSARLALARSEEGPVTMGDFREAIRMETGGAWNEESRGRIGF